MTATLASVHDYWLPGYELSTAIVFRQIQLFLGPSVRIRPFKLEGREGYRIHGAYLTEDQISDLKRQSREYERQQSIRMRAWWKDSDLQDADLNISSIVPLETSKRRPTQYTTSSYR